MNRIFTTSLFVLLAVGPALAAARRMDGPVAAQLVRVIDGDTLLVQAKPWPQQTVDVLVRIRGIDAPETHAKCSQQRQAAEKATQVLQQLTSDSESLFLSDISGDKYFGRIVAKVTLPDGRSAGDLMLDLSLVYPYSGAKKKPFPC